MDCQSRVLERLNRKQPAGSFKSNEIFNSAMIIESLNGDAKISPSKQIHQSVEGCAMVGV